MINIEGWSCDLCATMNWLKKRTQLGRNQRWREDKNCRKRGNSRRRSDDRVHQIIIGRRSESKSNHKNLCSWGEATGQCSSSQNWYSFSYWLQSCNHLFSQQMNHNNKNLHPLIATGLRKSQIVEGLQSINKRKNIKLVWLRSKRGRWLSGSRKNRRIGRSKRGRKAPTTAQVSSLAQFVKSE